MRRARKSQWFAGLITGVVLLASSLALGEFSLRQKQLMKWEDEVLAKAVEKSDEKCSMKLKATIDWKSFQAEVDKKLDGKLSRGFGSYCSMVPDNLWSMCTDADGKTSIQKKIKSYDCKFGGKDKRSISLKGGSLTFWVDWDAANNDNYIKGYLGKKL